MVSNFKGFIEDRQISKLITIVYGAKCYEEKSQSISTIEIWHGIQRSFSKEVICKLPIGGWVWLF